MHDGSHALKSLVVVEPSSVVSGSMPTVNVTPRFPNIKIS